MGAKFPYSLQIKNPNSESSSIFSSSSTSGSPTSTSTPKGSATPKPVTSLSTGAKAGIGIGGAVGVLIVIALSALFFYRYGKRRPAAVKNGDKDNNTSNIIEKSELAAHRSVLGRKKADGRMSAVEIGGSERFEAEGIQRNEMSGKEVHMPGEME